MAALFRLVVSGQAGGPPPAWAEACRAVFRLDAGAAARLWAQLPVTLIAVQRASADREWIARSLARGGAHVESAEQAGDGEPCAAHPRLAVDTPCPRCGVVRACRLCVEASSAGACATCASRASLRKGFRRVRIAILLFILVLVGTVTALESRRVTSWTAPLSVVIVPVDGGVPGATAWAAGLRIEDFQPVADFLAREAARYGRTSSPLVQLRLGRVIDVRPPEPPEDHARVLDVMLWSLKLRWWSFRTQHRFDLPSGKVHVYVLYDGQADGRLDSSFGIDRGRIGVVHTLVGAAESGWTNLAVAHELLHTLGATDKYADGGQAIFPDGYAEPERRPLRPQVNAEIMAGTIPETESAFDPARSLDRCVVGPATAREIGWLAPPKP